MILLETLFGWGTLWLAAAGVVYTILATLLIRPRLVAKPSPQDGPGVTLLKPLHLDEQGLEENLHSFFEQHYGGPLQIIFGVRSQSDPALRIARNLHKRFPQCDVHFVVDPSSDGINPKVANLMNMLGHAKHEFLILSDSDIAVSRDYVRTIVAELSSPNVGAVTCMYRGDPAANLWAVLKAMHIDYAFLPNVVTGTALGLAAPCFGSTVALRQSTLGEIGGFKAMSRHLADDYEIGRAVRDRGYDVKISSIVVKHSCSGEGLSDLVRHELRWARTVRLLNGPGYLGSVVTHAFPLAVIASGALAFSVTSLLILAGALAARLCLAWRIRAVLGSQAGPLWLLPIRDLLSFGVFLASFFGNSVYWRGTRYLTRAGGVLAQQ